MAMQSGFFNSVNGDRRYLADFMALFFSSIVGNGVYPDPANNLKVVENQNMTVAVRPGRIWINGYFGYDDSNHNITLDLADGILNRVDRVVARLDFSLREIVIDVKKGVVSSSPAPPVLQRDADVWELALADVRINAGTTHIFQSNITDLRLNKSLCGIVHGAIDQVDTTEIFEQYQSWLDKTTAKSERDFLDWFDNLKDALEGDAATALYLEIEKAEKRAKEYTDAAPEAMLQNVGRFETIRSSKDPKGTFWVVETKRQDGTLFQLAEMSNPDVHGYPKVRTVTTYKEDGRIVENTIVYDIKYDSDGDFLEVTPR